MTISVGDVGTACDRAVLRVEQRGSVRWLIFNRPELHNAQNVRMLEALDTALEDIARDRTVRVVVLAGNGRSFCSGHDLRQVVEDGTYRAHAATPEGRLWQERRLFAQPVQRFRELLVPTVCRVQGYCLAAGLMFAAAADFVVADTTAVFGSPILATQAVNDAELATFALRIGEQTAKRVFWLNERLDADQARAAGLVTMVVAVEDLDRAVNEMTEKLLSMPREALAISKQSLLFMANRRGERDVNDFHFMSHQLSHWTAEAQALLRSRVDHIVKGESPVNREGFSALASTARDASDAETA